MVDPALWIAFRDIPGLRRTEARELLQRFGGPERIFGRRPEDLGSVCSAAAAQWLARGPAQGPARAELERARAAKLEVLLQNDPGFPSLLLEIPDPPVLLYVSCAAGARTTSPVAPQLRAWETPSISIVGSRRATSRGREAARRFAADLARAGLVVVSGLAYGIDAAAHAGALEAGGRTVAFLAGGADRPGPAGNRALARRIVRGGGALLSEHPPGAEARASHFPDRNRLISGMSRATLVVEAREHSGSLWTARHALDQSREVLVIPGPVDTDACGGSNRLLVDGAAAVVEPEDALGLAVDRVALAPRPLPGEPHRSGCPGGADSERILRRVRAAPCGPDDLVRELGLSPSRVAALLVELELAGWITREGRRLACARPPAPASDR